MSDRPSPLPHRGTWDYKLLLGKAVPEMDAAIQQCQTKEELANVQSVCRKFFNGLFKAVNG